MLNVTPKIAKEIYAILIEHVGAEDDEMHQWSFCYNLTHLFPNPLKSFGFNNSMTSRNTQTQYQLKLYDGDPIYLKMEEPASWQITRITKVNSLISEIIRKEKERLRAQERRTRKKILEIAA